MCAGHPLSLLLFSFSQKRQVNQHGGHHPEVGHHIGFLKNILKVTVHHHAGKTGENAGRQGREPGGARLFFGHAASVDAPEADEHQRHQQQNKEDQAHIAHFHQDLEVIVVHVEIVPLIDDLGLHGDGAAKHAKSQAEEWIAVVSEVAHAVHPPAGTAASGSGFGKLLGKEIADAAGNKRHKQRRHKGDDQ